MTEEELHEISGRVTRIQTLVRQIRQSDMVAYAGATWDWHLMHYDTEYVKRLGFPAPIVDGQVLGALMAECLQDWLGPKAQLTRLAFRFKAPVFAGQIVSCGGNTVPSTDGIIHSELAVQVVDADGLVAAVAAQGSAEARIR